jgi:hypothetical protein
MCAAFLSRNFVGGLASTTKEPKMITSQLTLSHADARATELRRRAADRRAVQHMTASRKRRALRVPRLAWAGRVASA